jgi:hypothetical protein
MVLGNRAPNPAENQAADAARPYVTLSIAEFSNAFRSVVTLLDEERSLLSSWRRTVSRPPSASSAPCRGDPIGRHKHVE